MAAPNKNKETRTIVPGVWQDIMRTYESLPNARLLTTTLNQAEISILEGDFFRTYRRVVVPAGGTYEMKFTSPPSGVAFGLVSREIVPELAGVKYFVFRSSDVTVVPDSEWPIYNENGYSGKTSGALFQDVQTVIDEGVESDYTWIPQGTPQRTSGSLNRESGFKIIAADTGLMVRLENLDSTKTNEILLYFQWIEAPSEVTGL